MSLEKHMENKPSFLSKAVAYYRSHETFVAEHSGFATKVAGYMDEGCSFFQAVEQTRWENISQKTGETDPLTFRNKVDLYGNLLLGAGIQIGGELVVRIFPELKPVVEKKARWAWDRFDWPGDDEPVVTEHIDHEYEVTITWKGGTPEHAQSMHDELFGPVGHTNPVGPSAGSDTYGYYTFKGSRNEMEERVRDFNNKLKGSGISANIQDTSKTHIKDNIAREKNIRNHGK